MADRVVSSEWLKMCQDTFDKALVLKPDGRLTKHQLVYALLKQGFWPHQREHFFQWLDNVPGITMGVSRGKSKGRVWCGVALK